MRRTITFQLDDDQAKPIFLNLAATIQREIERGRLKPGDALPGTRALASSLKLHRNTVDAAYQELILQGWLESEPSRGTFVARDLPASAAPAEPRSMRRPQRHLAENTGVAPAAGSPPLQISDGTPDPRLMPRAELARAFRRALAAPSFLAGQGYGDLMGNLQLRLALSRYLADARGLSVAASEILVSRGSQMALFLTARTIVAPGQAVAVENPGYPLAWSAFRAAGARIVGVPVDDQGLSVDHLERLCARDDSLCAVYVTPHHQYPTTVTLPMSRRLQLMALAQRHHLTVIEDDYDHDYRFDGTPVLPLVAKFPPEVDLIYIGSLSKLLAASIRLGYVVAAPHRLRRMAELRMVIDRQGDGPLEDAVARFIVDGDLRRHALRARRIYRTRRDLLAAELSDRLATKLSFTIPAGGLALWLRLTEGQDSAWSRRAAPLGLAITPGSSLDLEPASATQGFRFGFAGLDRGELLRAVALLARSLEP